MVSLLLSRQAVGGAVGGDCEVNGRQVQAAIGTLNRFIVGQRAGDGRPSLPVTHAARVPARGWQESLVLAAPPVMLSWSFTTVFEVSV
jgi:hypothetical protein